TFDVGGTIGQALRAAAGGETAAERLRRVEESASRTSQANGSLMRISPLGIFYAGRPDQGAVSARVESRLTHAHPVCQDSCAAFVAALAVAVVGGSAEACYQAALREAERPQAQEAVRQALAGAAQSPPVDYQSQMGWVLIALQNAFYQLLHAPSLEEG